ncbi:hypothetical protein [Mycolicibacterium setense]|nr:hypothetical protein [Mycolicibacterium setense]
MIEAHPVARDQNDFVIVGDVVDDVLELLDAPVLICAPPKE